MEVFEKVMGVSCGCVLSTVYDIKFCRLNTSSAKLIWKLRSQPPLGAQLVQLRFAFSSSGQPIERYSVDKSASGHVVTGLTNKAFQLSVGLVWSERERLYFQSDGKDLGPLQTGVCVVMSKAY